MLKLVSLLSVAASATAYQHIKMAPTDLKQPLSLPSWRMQQLKKMLNKKKPVNNELDPQYRTQLQQQLKQPCDEDDAELEMLDPTTQKLTWRTAMQQQQQQQQPMQLPMQQPETLESLSQSEQFVAYQSSVSDIANEYSKLIEVTAGPDAYERSLAQLQFFDEDSVVQSYLYGDGQTWSGMDEIKGFFKDFFKGVNLESQTVKVVGVNEMDALALMEVEMVGLSTKTGKKFDATVLMVMELDALSNKIKTLLLVNKDKEQSHAFHTKAEEWLEELIMGFYTATPTELMDPNSNAWSKFSDDVVIKVNLYPMAAVSPHAEGDKDTWTGKQELIDHARHFGEKLLSNKVMMDKLPELIQEMDLKILFSTDREVWAKFTWPEGFGNGMIKHYMFDDAGRVTAEEITMLSDLKPWQMLSTPYTDTNKPQLGQQDYTNKRGKSWSMSNTVNIEGDVQIGKAKVGTVTSSKFTGSATFCDSTANQVCQDGSPCMEPLVKCLNDKHKCQCPN